VAHPGSSPSVCRAAKLAAGVIAATTALATAATSAGAAPIHLNSAGKVHVYRSGLTSAQIAAYSKHPNQRVVVLLRNQFAGTLHGGTRGLGMRADALSASQQPLLRELTSLNARNVKHYSFINAVAATVSQAEVTRLKSDPAVRAVVPDARVSLTPTGSAAAERGSAAAAAKRVPAPPVNTTKGICGTAKQPLLQPEALKQLAAATPHHGVTGKGVKIAVFPDGLDPNIKDFVRANGSHAIFDYRDFTGDGRFGLTLGGEAFGDASSIISQGRQTFDLSKEINPGLPLPNNCDIRIKGVAPGASLAVMKVFGGDSTFDSTILQGLDWAVSHDHVNVLSESFGSNPIPDPGNDPVSVFDAEAVAHGISVVASTGDAGTTNTIGGPAAASKGIIAAAASTSFQINAQVSQHGYQLAGFKGWESNNVSAISSSGFTDVGPNTVTVIAPGDGGWADCSPRTNIYLDCSDLFGRPGKTPPIEDFGGTSQSTPFTSGVVALVIQAYKGAHNGNAPSPATVKRIITSTATNLGIPSENQGAGQPNAARAVELARSYKTAHRTPARHGHTLVIGTQSIRKTAAPGSAFSTKVKVTNDGTGARTVKPVVKAFGPAQTISNATVAYDPSAPGAPTFTYWLDGSAEQYAEHDFTVPAGFQRLQAQLGFPASGAHAGQEVFEVLFDPHGKVAADSEVQGVPQGFGQVEVRNPIPGKWRAIYFSRPGSDKFSGNIATSVTVQKLLAVPHSVSPASAKLKPGASKSFTVRYRTPSSPGDAAAEVSFGPTVGAVPILTRAEVQPKVGTPGSFAGVLTTGNGRMSLAGQELSYDFTVPKGVKDVDVDVHVADPGYVVVGALVDPKHSPVDAQDSDFVDLTTTNPDGSSPDTQDQTLHLSWRTPTPGRWSLDLATAGGSGSGKTSSPITGTVAFNTVNVTSANVPNDASTMLQPDATRLATITVKNTGNSPEIYFVDPRLAGSSQYPLGFINNPSGQLPLGVADDADVPEALAPPASTSVTMVATANKPVNFTMTPDLSTPAVASTTGKTAVANYAASDVPASAWSCPVTLVGPFGSPTSGGQFACAAFARTRTFDDTVEATGGNLWDSFTDPATNNGFDPESSTVVQPGASTTLQVAITPTEDEEGATVSGFLAVQTLDVNTFSSDNLAHIPYRYTVATPPG
jgi:hypothetical protein